MNLLHVGSLPDFKCPRGSLLITDDPVRIKAAKVFDYTKHGLNTLPMEYRQAREFAAALYDDKDLMTYRNGRRAITRLVMHALSLSEIKYSRSKDDEEAKGVIDDVLLSPDLRRMFSTPPPRWLYSGSSVVVHLPLELGDDAKVIANVLMSQFKGQIVIPKYGRYARDHHARFIDGGRLMVGVYTLSELPDNLRDRAMLMPKAGKGCTFEDAEVLAKYAGLIPDRNREDNPYNRFVAEAMRI